jgi:hypothetical protein
LGNKKMSRFLGIVLIVVGIVLAILSYFVQITLSGLSLLWWGSFLILLGFLVMIVYRTRPSTHVSG